MKMNAIIILSLLLKVAVSIPDADNQLHIYALPVGQGDCTVIQCPRGNGDPVKGTVSIIDAGSSTGNVGIDGQGIVDYLAGTQIRYVFLTHADLDHLNYMDDILYYYGQQLPYGKKRVHVFHPCSWDKYSCYISSWYAVPHEVPRCFNIDNCHRSFPILNLCPNYQSNINAGNSVKLSVVASAFKWCVGNKAHNEDSLIVKITYGQTSTLITGDFELTPNDMALFLQTAGSDLRSTIYKLSHHGAYNGEANQKQFLDVVGASYVFSSSGYKYGHPRCEIAKYYDAILPNNVANHDYTCFDRIGNRQYQPFIKNIKKPIYVTSALIRKNKVWTESSNMVVKFNIDGNINNIKVEISPLGNDKILEIKYPQLLKK